MIYGKQKQPTEFAFFYSCSDRKRKTNAEKRELQGLGPPRKYQKRTGELDANGEPIESNIDEDGEESGSVPSREYKTEVEVDGVYEVEQEQVQVVTMGESQTNATYSE